MKKKLKYQECSRFWFRRWVNIKKKLRSRTHLWNSKFNESIVAFVENHHSKKIFATLGSTNRMWFVHPAAPEGCVISLCLWFDNIDQGKVSEYTQGNKIGVRSDWKRVCEQNWKKLNWETQKAYCRILSGTLKHSAALRDCRLLLVQYGKWNITWVKPS